MLASQQILRRVAELLAAGGVAGGQVNTDKWHPVASFPACRPRLVDEDLAADGDADEDITWPREQTHRVRLEIEQHVQASSGLDDALAAEVLLTLRALEGSQAAATLAPLVGCNLRVTGLRYQVAVDGEAANGKATVQVEVTFTTRSNDPETLI